MYIFFQISIDDSQVPSVEYELNAVQYMQEAYQIFPNKDDERLNSFLNLFGKKYPLNNWTVAHGCTYLFLPNDYLSIRLKIEDQTANSTDYVKIFGSSKVKETNY